MTSRILAKFGTLAVVLMAIGCGPDCVSLCEEGNSCPGALKVNCDTQCTAQEAVNPKGYCEDQFDDLLECLDHREDVCETGAAVCAKRIANYQDCVAGYCYSKQADFGANPQGDDQADADCRALGL